MMSLRRRSNRALLAKRRCKLVQSRPKFDSYVPLQCHIMKQLILIEVCGIAVVLLLAFSANAWFGCRMATRRRMQRGSKTWCCDTRGAQF
jgi:hypothetical protein